MYKYLTFLLFVLFASSSALAQITADTTSGCVPLTGVEFSYSPTGLTNIVWDFGDGASANNKDTVMHTFGEAGIYTVSFSGYDGNTQRTDAITVTVYGSPEAGFTTTSDTVGCVGLSVSFLDTSVGYLGSNITKWKWDFNTGTIIEGDGQPSYTFSTSGIYNVNIIVEDENGCEGSASKDSVVIISDLPTVNIVTDPSPAFSCKFPFDVSFDGSGSTSNSPNDTTNQLSYSWAFGNDSSSIAAIPLSQNYDNAGIFNASLTITDNNGCSAKDSTNIEIHNVVADFYADGATNDTVCKTVEFINTSVGSTITYWNYGDNISGFSNLHTYSNAGTYNVFLTVSTDTTTCTDTITKTIIVEEVEAKLTSTPHYSCSAPYTVDYSADSSINAEQWSWSFGSTGCNVYSPGHPYYRNLNNLNRQNSNLQNPSITYIDPDTFMYSINHPLIYGVCLSVTSPHGCVDVLDVVYNDTLFVPNARFMPDTFEGCAPLTVNFYDSSYSKETIISREWVWGDGNTSTGNDTALSHTFLSAGEYNVYLRILNDSGCGDTSYAVRIKVGAPLSPFFSTNPSSVCLNTPVQFTDATPSGNLIDTWHYSADSSNMQACLNESDPSWEFTSGVGMMDITLTVGYNGCYSDTTITDAIEIKGPHARFDFDFLCDSPLDYNFSCITKGVDSLTWDFGDGNTTSSPAHSFSTSGDYLVTLTSNGSSGCSAHTDTGTVHVRQLSAAILTDTLLCMGEEYSFNSSNSVDVFASCANGYQWLFDSISPPYITDQETAPHTYTGGGEKTVLLIVKDINNCKDTVQRKIKVFDLFPYFASDTLYGCLPLDVNFTDTSHFDTTITSWEWNFGDESVSNDTNPTHTYQNYNTNNYGVVINYNISLKITDVLGCTDIVNINNIIPSVPDSLFAVSSDSTGCFGDIIRFSSSYTNHDKYDWNFGYDTIFTNDTGYIAHAYLAADTFDITLTVTDSIGCKGTYKRYDYIEIQAYPIAGFESDKDEESPWCYPKPVEFTDTSVIEPYGSRTWHFNTGASIASTNPMNKNYVLPGTYTISLETATPFGCSDSVGRTIEIKGPIADFDISKNAFCKGDTITVSLKDTSDVLSWDWDFGDGTVDNSQVDPIDHTYSMDFFPQSGQSMVQLTVYTENMACPKSYSKTITVHEVIADFLRNSDTTAIDTIHCFGPADIITNTSRNADSWEWNFGDGETFSGETPPHHRYDTGTFTIQLNISDTVYKCVDTIRKDITIYPLPVVFASNGDTCRDQSILIYASGGISYEWSPLDGIEYFNQDTIQDSIKAGPDQTTSYQVIVTDTNGCKNTAYTEVIIHQRPDTSGLPEGTAIVIGDSVLLESYIGNNYLYFWSPTEGLSSPFSHNTYAKPLETTTYTVSIIDNIGCFNYNRPITITVNPETSIALPNAFTPNGDNDNDVIYVKGWGIKELLEFSIYNRWGEKVFTTDDINEGWDGYYNGEIQNIDTYVYVVRSISYHEETTTTKGYIELLR